MPLGPKLSACELHTQDQALGRNQMDMRNAAMEGQRNALQRIKFLDGMWLPGTYICRQPCKKRTWTGKWKVM